MYRLKKCIHKDRYFVLRGGILLALTLLLCSCLVIQLFISYNIVAEEERAADAARQVTAQFEQMIANSLTQMAGAASLIDDGSEDEAMLLRHMVEYGPFADSAILSAGEGPACKDGISHSISGVSARLSVREDGCILLALPLADGREYVGWLDADQLNVVFASAFEEDYGYALYNASTGAFLINKSIFSGASYYDALLHLNENGDMETLLSSGIAQAYIDQGAADGESYYIAQQQTSVEPWSIALLIPEHLVHSVAWSGRILPYATCAAAALMLVILFSYTAIALRRIRFSNRNTARALNTSDHMMDLISRNSQTTIFVYHCGQENLMACYDGLELMQYGGGLRLHTLSAILNACGMDESEAARVRDRLRKIEPGESAELLVRCSTQNREECILRFALHAVPDSDREIICSISDCTREQESQDRAELENSYQTAVRARTSSIWQINISRNRWCLLHNKKRDRLNLPNIHKGEWRDYNADLGGHLRDYLHPADYESYAETMSIVSIASMFRSGRVEFTQDYRVRGSNAAEYEWHRMRVRIWLNPKTNDILANLYVFNVDAEKNAELERGERKRILHQTLTALGGIYYGLYYVDLDNNLSYTARSLGGDLATQLCAPYKATFDDYIARVVHPEDQEGLRAMLSAYTLRKSMTEGTHFQRREYRCKAGDGYEWAILIIQPARFENGCVKEVVLAIRYIGSDKQAETA